MNERRRDLFDEIERLHEIERLQIPEQDIQNALSEILEEYKFTYLDEESVWELAMQKIAKQRTEENDFLIDNGRNIDYANLHMGGDFNRTFIRLKEEEIDYLGRIATALESIAKKVD